MRWTFIFTLTFCALHSFGVDDNFLELPHSQKDLTGESRSNWNISFGTELIEYFSYHGYQGETRSTGTGTEVIDRTKKYTPGEFSSFGFNLRFGRDFRLGKRLSLGLGLTGFFFNDSDKEAQKVDEDTSFPIGATKDRFNLLGGLISANLGVPFKLWKLKFRPHIEAAFGKGESEVHYSYFFDNNGASNPGAFNEKYNATLEESIDIMKVGIGIDIIASNGLFTYLKVYYSSYSISDSTASGKVLINGTSTEADVCSVAGVTTCQNSKDSIGEEFSSTTFSLGFGYRF